MYACKLYYYYKFYKLFFKLFIVLLEMHCCSISTWQHSVRNVLLLLSARANEHTDAVRLNIAHTLVMADRLPFV